MRGKLPKGGPQSQVLSGKLGRIGCKPENFTADLRFEPNGRKDSFEGGWVFRSRCIIGRSTAMREL